jgi:hypothetical protein
MGKFSKNGVYDDRYASRLTLYTSDVATIAMEPKQMSASGLARPFDFYRLEPIIHRYHFFLVMPGGLSDSLDNADFDKLRVAVFDERRKDEIFRFELHRCGDGILDPDEECDYARVPPAGDYIDLTNQRFFKDAHGVLTMCTRACQGDPAPLLVSTENNETT